MFAPLKCFIAPLLLLPLVAASCIEAPDGPSSGGLSLGHDQITPPPDWAPRVSVALVDGPPVLYLELNGAALDHNDSFIIPARFGVVELPPFDADAFDEPDREAAIAALRDRVAEHFQDTGLQIVIRRPTNTAFTTIVVGGYPAHIGESRGVAGIAPFDVGNRNPADIGFVFSDNIALIDTGPSLDMLAAVIAHEAGHTYGLDHVVEPVDLMFPQAHEGMDRFTAAERLDGGWQDAPAILRRVLGPPEDEPTRTCGDDPYEPNDARDHARTWALSAVEATACAGDDDWFRVELPADFIMELVVDHDEDTSFDPPVVYRPRGRTPLGAAFIEAGRVGVRFVTEVDGVYRVRIRSDAESDAQYTLTAYGEAG